MGATTTLAVTLSSSWSLVADGAAYATIGIVPSGPVQTLLAIATSIPAQAETNYIVLPADGSLQVPLSVTDKLYARTVQGAAILRVYRVGV